MAGSGKVSYRSKDVVIVDGSDPAAAAAQLPGMGWTEKDIKEFVEFTGDILMQARVRNLTQQQTFTAILNALVYMIDNVKTMEDRSKLVSLVTEALCAAVGGGLDTAQRG